MQAVNMGNSFNDTGAAQLGISETGTLLYVPGGIKPEPRWSLVWVDRNGDRVPLIPEPGPYWGPRLSPDGRRVAFLTGGLLANRHVWIHDVGRGGATRLTADGEHYYAPVWTPDGRRVVFSSRVGQVARNLFWQPVDGSGPAERLTTSDTVDIATSWSPDGTLVFDRQRGIWLLSLEKGVPKSRPLLQTKFFTGFAAFSPNGRWLAYTSDESGRTEVYVRAFPGPGGRYPVSIGGGISPVWARNGREIFYTEWNRNNRTSVLKLMAVDVTTSPAFTAGRPRMLFAGSYLPGSYDVALDGRRFLMVDTSTDPLPPPVTQMVLVVNWLEELKRRTK
jgi:Tol biopolymer transport system component